jgi:cell wall-associated NlpC family hydrolase
MSGAALARAAEALVGTKFRLHGRDPVTGLDCVGVLAAALAAIGKPAPLPSGYTIKLRTLDHWLPDPASCGFAPIDAAIAAGDVLLLDLGPCQQHLVIATAANRFVHAHAGLRRVVESSGPLPGPVLHHWRLLPET